MRAVEAVIGKFDQCRRRRSHRRGVLGRTAAEPRPGRGIAARVEHRVCPGGRPRLVRPGLLREHVLRVAAHRPAGRTGNQVHPSLHRRLGLLADAIEHPDGQVPGPHGHYRLHPGPASGRGEAGHALHAPRTGVGGNDHRRGARQAGIPDVLQRQVAPGRQRVRAARSGLRGGRRRRVAGQSGPGPAGGRPADRIGAEVPRHPRHDPAVLHVPGLPRAAHADPRHIPSTSTASGRRPPNFPSPIAKAQRNAAASRVWCRTTRPTPAKWPCSTTA